MRLVFNPFTGNFDFVSSAFLFINRLLQSTVYVGPNKTLLQREPTIEDGGGYLVDDGGEVLLL